MSKSTILANKVGELRGRLIALCRENGIRHLASSLSALDILVEVMWDMANTGDTVILSKGHASPAWWVVQEDRDADLVKGLDVGISAHLPAGKAGMVMTTGSLGHGLGVGVGIALADSNHRVFVILGDAELCEGSVWEAVTLAHAMKLDNLVAIVDWNKAGATGLTDDMGIDSLVERFKAFGWSVHVSLKELDWIKNKPQAFIISTIKGSGVLELENDPAGCHGRLS